MSQSLLILAMLMAYLFISSCALFQRHHTYIEIYDTKYHPDSYMLNIELHKLHDYMKENNEDYEVAIKSILEEQIKINGLCPNGFEVRGRTLTRHGDVSEIFKCK